MARTGVWGIKGLLQVALISVTIDGCRARPDSQPIDLVRWEQDLMVTTDEVDIKKRKIGWKKGKTGERKDWWDAAQLNDYEAPVNQVAKTLTTASRCAKSEGCEETRCEPRRVKEGGGNRARDLSLVYLRFSAKIECNRIW